MTLKAIIIEDEEHARSIIKKYIEEIKSVEVIGEYADGFSGVKAINELKPDMIFLDIQMPRLTGFEVLELIEHKPAIIFTTAYDQYAVKAFEVNASDYLLKPFTKERFNKAINNVINSLKVDKRPSEKIEKLTHTLDESDEKLQRIAVRVGNIIHVLPVEDISHIESQGDYVSIHTSADGFLKEKPMNYYETHLDNKLFVRIHRSYIVNVSMIERLEYYDKESYIAILKNNLKLKVSTNGYKLLKQRLNL